MKTSPTCSSRTLLYVLLVLSTAAYSSGLNIACAFKNAFAGHPANLKFFFILFVIGRVHISHGKPQPWGRTMLMEKHSLKKGTRKWVTHYFPVFIHITKLLHVYVKLIRNIYYVWFCHSFSCMIVCLRPTLVLMRLCTLVLKSTDALQASRYWPVRKK